MPPLTPKALIFDVFGTCVDWRGSIIAEGRALDRRWGTAVDWPALADAWRGRYQPALDEVRSGRRPARSSSHGDDAGRRALLRPPGGARVRAAHGVRASAPRIRRQAEERPAGGPEGGCRRERLRGPGDEARLLLTREIQARHGFAGALRALAVFEARHGFCRGAPNAGGCGGHF